MAQPRESRSSSSLSETLPLRSPSFPSLSQIFSSSRIPLFDEENDYINEDHISAFANALAWEEPEEKVVRDSPVKKSDFIASQNDWYPVHNHTTDKKVTKKKSRLHNEFTNSASYTLLRWPILFFVGLWIVFLCVMYSLVRAYVALSEYYLTWVGERKKLRDKLRNCKSYEEWLEYAVALDKYLGLDKWSVSPKFSYYDYRTISRTMNRLVVLRDSGSDADLMVFLQGCLKANFAGIENKQLYSHRYFGTKKIVHQYVDLVSSCIDKVTDSDQIPFADKRRFFRIVSKNYGKTALCLSGGACFAYNHFGVVKALLDNDLLPSIISGTSGGGLIAALACTRSNEDLKQLLVPQLARKITACEDPWYVWIPRFWRTGARFDSIAWARKSNFFTQGSTTFSEAVKISGRKLNISTVPADPHSPVILCNNITSPNCVIWSSLLASSAVPGILNPVVLMMKDPRTGEVAPLSLGNKWRDGSLRTDIPIESLNTYYNVNFSVVSQVNPHISLFFYAPKGTVGRPVAVARRYTHRQQFASFRGGFIGTAIEQLLRLEITKWLKIIKSLDLLPHLLEQDWSNIWLQKFTGTITVWPRNRLKDFWHILDDPTEARLEEMLLTGQRSIFPRILFIKHRLTIERAIERGRQKTKLPNSVGEKLSAQTSNFSGSGFEVQTTQYEDNEELDTDTSDEDARIVPSPFETRYNESLDDDDYIQSDDLPMSGRSTSASPDVRSFDYHQFSDLEHSDGRH